MVPAQFVIGQKHKQNDEAGSRASWNTPRSDSRTVMSYGMRMAVSFALTSFMTVIVLVCVVTVVWGGAFSDYARANMTEIAEIASKKLADEYERNDGWSTAALAAVGESSIVSDDIGMQVVDADGTVVYDDTWPAASLAARIKSEEEPTFAQGSGVREESPKKGSGLVSSAPTSKDEVVSHQIVTGDGDVVGTVRMWVLGSDALLTKADAAFREKTFNAMGMAAFIAAAISVVIGFFVSNMLTTPIRRITSTAKQIRDGDLSARTNMRGDDEIDQLGEIFDEMTTSLEKDLKHERRLTSDVAHELRTPLQAMLATVEGMQDGVLPCDDKHLETVASETRRLSRLVQQMLDLSRMENRAAPLRLRPVDTVALVRNVVDTQHPLFRARDLHLRFADETQGRSATIELDADMITQAVINLMSNAMRYTPEDGWVVVKVGIDRRHVLISVSDTGIGIAKEDLSRIFGRFWRADASRAREAGGLGVGLAVTKQIVERHHGFIAVESELGKGTTFTIHLPREHTAGAPSSTMMD
ncbi:MAG: HAMP domain-containing sensor histidine kinase [Collinsella sp.]|nr:HAMP domain-containing sensor histidine kinase [Collinsella sp.]